MELLRVHKRNLLTLTISQKIRNNITKEVNLNYRAPSCGSFKYSTGIDRRKEPSMRFDSLSVQELPNRGQSLQETLL